MFNDLSYRYKTPLILSMVILLTASIVSANLIVQIYQDTRRDVIWNALDLGKVLARTIRPFLLHDDLWRTYETINIPFNQSSGGRTPARLAIVLDAQNRIYVSTDPSHFPILGKLSETKSRYAILEHQISARGEKPFAMEHIDPHRILMVVPILADDKTPLGTLILSYPKSILVQHLYHSIKRVVIVTLAIITILLPFGWYLSKFITKPLIQLAQCMGKIGHELPADIQCGLHFGRDEIGFLGRRFENMLNELREKQAMERRMLASERLAAIGRLTAGIAHEINNPLGGMLNAINTFDRHGNPDLLTNKTISLIGRGLLQIKQTVADLLIEARLENHALTPQDIEDARTLIMEDVNKKQISLNWHNEIEEPLPLPSTQVRQILLNLLLNAVKATHEHGHLDCQITKEPDKFKLAVNNDGDYIKPEKMEHLFEPFSNSGPEGHGLGLWITYQLVQQMNGQIEVESQPDRTAFTVTLPIEQQ
uniref:histidine kinase n=1 Tax=mine drainage metagenome TaxID=410659 RepID=E6QQ89_9ZZZZ